jgi:hypothetical protein
MNSQKQNPGSKLSVPQMRVRSDLRAGDDLATCQNNLHKWQQRYNAAYNKAKQRGCI